MEYDKFSQLEPPESDYTAIDEKIMASSPYFAEGFQSIVSHIERMKEQYYTAGEEMGFDYEDVKYAWNLCIEDIVWKVYHILE